MSQSSYSLREKRSLPELQLCQVARNRGLGLVPARILARSRFRARLRTLRIRGLDFPLSTWTVRGQLTAGLDSVLPELNDELERRLSRAGRGTLPRHGRLRSPKGDA